MQRDKLKNVCICCKCTVSDIVVPPSLCFKTVKISLSFKALGRLDYIFTCFTYCQKLSSSNLCFPVWSAWFFPQFTEQGPFYLSFVDLCLRHDNHHSRPCSLSNIEPFGPKGRRKEKRLHRSPSMNLVKWNVLLWSAWFIKKNFFKHCRSLTGADPYICIGPYTSSTNHCVWCQVCKEFSRRNAWICQLSR